MSEKRIHDGFVENVRIRYRLGAWDRDKQFSICFLQSYPRLVREMPPKSQNMKALLYPEFDTLQLCEQSVPEPAADEVLLRVSACGICGSELESFQTRSPRRPPPLVMGHEFCGVIERLGEAVEGWAPGDRVVSNSVVPCDNCPLCSRGDTHLCEKRQIFGMHRFGAFAEWTNVPARCLLPWPDDLPAEAACLAEPLGNGVHIVRLTQHLPAKRVLVIGAGPIGLMCQQALQVLRGSQVLVSDLVDERLQAASAVGAELVINAGREDLAGVIQDWTDGQGMDLVVDAVGSEITKKQSIAACRPGGAAVWIGLHGNSLTFDSYDLTLPEKQVLGTYSAKMEELAKALELLADGKIEVAQWVQSFPLDEGVDAFLRMVAAKGNDIKAVLMP